MNQPDLHPLPAGPVPILGHKPQQPDLTHYLVVVEKDGAMVEEDYLATGMAFDTLGNMLIIMNDRPVGGYAMGQWKSWRRADLQPATSRDL